MKTASPLSKFNTYSTPSKLRAVRSKCPTYRSYCGRCEHEKKFENDVCLQTIFIYILSYFIFLL